MRFLLLLFLLFGCGDDSNIDEDERRRLLPSNSAGDNRELNPGDECQFNGFHHFSKLKSSSFIDDTFYLNKNIHVDISSYTYYQDCPNSKYFTLFLDINLDDQLSFSAFDHFGELEVFGQSYCLETQEGCINYEVNFTTIFHPTADAFLYSVNLLKKKNKKYRLNYEDYTGEWIDLEHWNILLSQMRFDNNYFEKMNYFYGKLNNSSVKFTTGLYFEDKNLFGEFSLYLPSKINGYEVFYNETMESKLEKNLNGNYVYTIFSKSKLDGIIKEVQIEFNF